MSAGALPTNVICRAAPHALSSDPRRPSLAGAGPRVRSNHQPCESTIADMGPSVAAKRTAAGHCPRLGTNPARTPAAAASPMRSVPLAAAPADGGASGRFSHAVTGAPPAAGHHGAITAPKQTETSARANTRKGMGRTATSRVGGQGTAMRDHIATTPRALATGLGPRQAADWAARPANRPGCWRSPCCRGGGSRRSCPARRQRVPRSSPTCRATGADRGSRGRRRDPRRARPVLLRHLPPVCR